MVYRTTLHHRSVIARVSSVVVRFGLPPLRRRRRCRRRWRWGHGPRRHNRRRRPLKGFTAAGRWLRWWRWRRLRWAGRIWSSGFIHWLVLPVVETARAVSRTTLVRIQLLFWYSAAPAQPPDIPASARQAELIPHQRARVPIQGDLLRPRATRYRAVIPTIALSNPWPGSCAISLGTRREVRLRT